MDSSVDVCIAYGMAVNAVNKSQSQVCCNLILLDIWSMSAAMVTIQ